MTAVSPIRRMRSWVGTRGGRCALAAALLVALLAGPAFADAQADARRALQQRQLEDSLRLNGQQNAITRGTAASTTSNTC